MTNNVRGNVISQWLAETDTNPVWTNVRRTDGVILDKNITMTQSAEVDPTRQAPFNVKTQSAIEGSINCEFPVKDAAVEILLKSVMQNTFAVTDYTASTISFDNGTSVVDDTADLAFADLEVGHFFQTIGGLNDGSVFQVATKTDDGTITVTPAPVTEAAGTSINLKGKNIRNNANVQPLYVQERLPSATDVLYRTYNNVQVGAFEATVPTGGLITSSYSFIGLSKLPQTTQVAGSTDNPVTNDRIIGSVSGVGRFIVDGVDVDPSTVCYTDFSISIDNGLTGEYGIGKDGACIITDSAVSVTGSLNSFVDATNAAAIDSEKNKLDNETLFSLGAEFQDQNGNKIIFYMPSVQYSTLDQTERANGQSLKNTGAYTANGKSAAGYTVQCTLIEVV